MYKSILKAYREAQENGQELEFLIPLSGRSTIIASSYPVTVQSGQLRQLVRCTIDEARHKISDNYKITLVEKDPDDPLSASSETFYIMDLESLMRESPDRFKMEAVNRVAEPRL
jgi:hypothetical protein